MSAKAVVPVRTSSTVASAPVLQGLNLFIYIYVLYHSKSGMVGYCMHFIRVHLARDYCVYVSATVWQLLALQLYCANALSATYANAVPLHTHLVVLIVPRFLIKRLLLEMPERAKTVCICMHAHTNCKLVWQAPYQSLLGGVLVNVCIFHERAGYTLVSCIFACSS